MILPVDHICAPFSAFVVIYLRAFYKISILLTFRCCSEVVAGIVAKVLNARPKSKALGINICLMYVEIEKQDVVIVRF